jgi:hypothetical protein
VECVVSFSVLLVEVATVVDKQLSKFQVILAASAMHAGPAQGVGFIDISSIFNEGVNDVMSALRV